MLSKVFQSLNKFNSVSTRVSFFRSILYCILGLCCVGTAFFSYQVFTDTLWPLVIYLNEEYDVYFIFCLLLMAILLPLFIVAAIFPIYAFVLFEENFKHEVVKNYEFQSLLDKDFKEVISHFGLQTKQVEPNWKKIEKLVKKFNKETNLFERNKKILDFANKDKKLSDKELQDIYSYLNSIAIQFMNISIVGAAQLMEEERFVKYFFNELSKEVGDNWNTICVVYLFPGANSSALPKSTRQLLFNFVTQGKDREKVLKQLLKIFVVAHPNYSFFNFI